MTDIFRVSFRLIIFGDIDYTVNMTQNPSGIGDIDSFYDAFFLLLAIALALYLAVYLYTLIT